MKLATIYPTRVFFRTTDLHQITLQQTSWMKLLGRFMLALVCPNKVPYLYLCFTKPVYWWLNRQKGVQMSDSRGSGRAGDSGGGEVGS